MPTPRPTTCPAILIAAPASGQGKTTVTAALARLHTRQGRKVRVFKCGPDFLDPFWLSLASGAPVHQLDMWMTGEADCRARLHAAALHADLILIEGVMGLFDGEPSAADLARHFGIAVLAVVDASAMAGTFGALAYGLQHYQPGLPWAGVLANKVASSGHAQMLEHALQEPEQWMGALMRGDAYTLPERHLGLVSALELPDAMARLDAAADALATTELGQLDAQQWQRFTVPFNAPEIATQPAPQLLAGCTIAIAHDRAFCFIYQANLDALEQLGARLVFFSPLADSALPLCDALWLPGGYPELHAQSFSDNTSLAHSVKLHSEAGKPVWAECGGMMVLFEELVTKDGQTYPMWGLLQGSVAMQNRLSALGPQEFEFGAHTMRGHTFHYSKCATDMQPSNRAKRMSKFASPLQNSAPDGEALYKAGSVQASYFHAWFASNLPATAALFLEST